jgi:hypothetical protein
MSGIDVGEAKRRKHEARALRAQLEVAVPQVAQALRKLATAASSHLGSDCYVHAELGRALLADLGITAQRVVGYAAWRVGPGDGDVISHTREASSYLPPGAKGLAYHAWLQASDFLIDFTTYQLQRKARELDAADGGHTQVVWCPDYLLLPRSALRSYREVAVAPGPGVAYYEAQPQLDRIMKEQFTLDPDDLTAARLVLAHPEATVTGPNQLLSGEAR